MGDLWQAINRKAKETGSLYADDSDCRAALVRFLNDNRWFGVTGRILDLRCAEAKTEVPGLGDAELYELMEKLDLWFRACKRSDAEKTSLLLSYAGTVYPGTAGLYEDFLRRTGKSDEQRAWVLLDFLLAHLKKELAEYSTDETDGLVRAIYDGTSRNAMLLFLEFFEFIHQDDNGWKYRIGHKNKADMDADSAYPFKDFAAMAYCLFNDESLKENRVLEKAVESRTAANLWLYLSLHFISALRSADLERIQMPVLEVSGQEARQRIKRGDTGWTRALLQELEIRIRYIPMRPGKTERYRNIPDLKIYIPENLKDLFAVMFALAASWNQEEGIGRAVSRNTSVAAIRRVFGAGFAEALHGKNFSTRRANKSYMQGIESVSGRNDVPVKGYMLAALARSHKQGLGSFPEVTELYLRDAKFSGYTAEFIAYEMFQRGVLGFIPHLMLEIYAGSGYKRLSVPAQTRAIKILGLDAASSESVAHMTEARRADAGRLIKELALPRQTMGAVLRRIASGAAPGKQEGHLCLLSAVGRGCPEMSRTGCLGCRFDICTKAVMYGLLREYRRLKGNADMRSRKIIKQFILPSVAEMLATINRDDHIYLEKVMEWGLEAR